jgi:DNA-binding NtrC family response regulator
VTSLLIVDADRNFRQALEIALRLDGVRACGASTAAEGASLLVAGRWNLVAIDSLLPGADALLGAARALGLRVIAIGPHRELLERAARLHHVLTLEKPFAADALLAPLAA